MNILATAIMFLSKQAALHKNWQKLAMYSTKQVEVMFAIFFHSALKDIIL